MPATRTCAELQRISSALAAGCEALRFGPHVSAVYNPLVYAAAPHAMYLERAGAAPRKVIFLGMNPGPWGMAQTGVPFGEVAAVREWLGIQATVAKPAGEHPKRPVLGFACARSEVSGRRLWGLFRERFKTCEDFFRDHYVANYCPLVFMGESGANITPDKLPAHEAAALFELCDRALADTVAALKPDWLIGVGGFAKKRIDRLSARMNGEAGGKPFSAAQILHPSPASPRANAGWGGEVTKTLLELGVWG